jgi:hypothetical protein
MKPSLAIAAIATVLCACSASSDTTSDAGATAPTVVDQPLTFSPITDSIDKFLAGPYPMDNGENFPMLEVVHEADLGTGNCSMLALPDGQQSAALAWFFAAPAGKTFEHVALTWSVYVDPRASDNVDARAMLVGGTTEVDLSLMDASSTETADQDDIDSATVGQSYFTVAFQLDNSDYTSELTRIYSQALRQCPGDPVPFSVSATFQ